MGGGASYVFLVPFSPPRQLDFSKWTGVVSIKNTRDVSTRGGVNERGALYYAAGSRLSISVGGTGRAINPRDSGFDYLSVLGRRVFSLHLSVSLPLSFTLSLCLASPLSRLPSLSLPLFPSLSLFPSFSLPLSISLFLSSPLFLSVFPSLCLCSPLSLFPSLSRSLSFRPSPSAHIMVSPRYVPLS